MSTKILAILYILMYGSLLVVGLFVALFASSGRPWGIAGAALFGWLIWGQAKTLFRPGRENR
jgi:predicted membrane metal-binding protein